MTSRAELVNRQKAPLATPSDIEPEAVTQISVALNILLADVFVLYFKTKNFHWHMSGPHFHDYHRMIAVFNECAQLHALWIVVLPKNGDETLVASYQLQFPHGR
jgi:hypothetical protein